MSRGGTGTVTDAPADPDDPVGRPRQARRLTRSPYLIGGLLLALGVAWVLVTGMLARHELDQARAGIPRLRTLVAAGQVRAAGQLATDIGQHAHRAHSLTTGPAWWAGAALPWAGTPLRTVRGLTASLDGLGHTALPALAAAASTVDPATLLAGGRVDVATLAATAPALDDATARLAQARGRVAALPATTWLSTVDHARASLLVQLDGAQGTVAAADQVVRLLPPMLGQQHPQRYFIGLQNEAEARGTGGLPGVFAIAVADKGRVSVTYVAPDSALAGVHTGLKFDADYERRYGSAQPADYFGNSNISPHFPYAARIWAAMWERRSGQHVDGAVAVDTTALSYLLGAVGPAPLPGGGTVSASQLVPLAESGEYARFSDTALRKRYIVGVARAVESHLLAARGDPARLLSALRRATAERRLLVWSADPAVQSRLAGTTLAGIVPDGPEPYAGLVVVNAGGNKLDYYLDRTLAVRRTGCGGARVVTATITLTNRAPRSGLPAIVTMRQDRPAYPTRPGDQFLLVSYYATAGSELSTVDLDGAPSTISPQRENGHSVYTAGLELPAGRTRTLVLHLTEPAVPGPVTVLRQPLARPLEVSVTTAPC
jgi:Protein of unknown function (DUF4012)